MSTTIVDMPKVAQMLDAGWHVELFKNPMGSYSAEAIHHEQAIMDRTRARLVEIVRDKWPHSDVEGHVDSFHFDGDHLLTDDFTPEQALTRLAYKAVDGQIL